MLPFPASTALLVASWLPCTSSRASAPQTSPWGSAWRLGFSSWPLAGVVGSSVASDQRTSGLIHFEFSVSTSEFTLMIALSGSIHADPNKVPAHPEFTVSLAEWLPLGCSLTVGTTIYTHHHPGDYWADLNRIHFQRIPPLLARLFLLWNQCDLCILRKTYRCYALRYHHFSWVPVAGWDAFAGKVARLAL